MNQTMCKIKHNQKPLQKIASFLSLIMHSVSNIWLKSGYNILNIMTNG